MTINRDAFAESWQPKHAEYTYNQIISKQEQLKTIRTIKMAFLAAAYGFGFPAYGYGLGLGLGYGGFGFAPAFGYPLGFW